VASRLASASAPRESNAFPEHWRGRRRVQREARVSSPPSSRNASGCVGSGA
jgi:hypothetical protein